MHGPTVRWKGEAFSYERDTPAILHQIFVYFRRGPPKRVRTQRGSVSLCARYPCLRTHEDRYRGTSLIRKRPPPRNAVGPEAHVYCRVLGGGVFLLARCPCTLLKRTHNLLLLKKTHDLYEARGQLGQDEPASG